MNYQNRILLSCITILVGALLVNCYPRERLAARAWVTPGLPDEAHLGSTAIEASTADPAATSPFMTASLFRREFPETAIESLRSKSDLGIAFSGGGNRAAVCALGQVRALTELKVMDRVRYISSVSGGSWFCVPYTFFQGDDSSFLGQYLPPDLLKRNALNATPQQGSFALCASHASTPVLVAMCSMHGDENFAHRMNKIYLKPFGTLGDEHRFFCYDRQSLNAIIERNPSLTDNDFNMTKPGRPYLIANSVLAKKGPTPTDRYLPVEITPNYTGSAAFSKPDKWNRQSFGGGYVESFAYDSKLDTQRPSKFVDSQWSTNVILPKRNIAFLASPRFSLADIAASSGSAPTLIVPLASSIVGFPEFNHWSPGALPGVTHGEMLHTDGGGIDNAGIIPLLRRRIGTIIAFVNDEMTFDNGNVDKPVFPEYVGALFGVERKTCYASKRCKVFAKDEYGKLSDYFQKAWKKNGPVIIHRKQPYITEENTSYGIPGGHKVRMIWVFLGGYKRRFTCDESFSNYPEPEPRKGSLAKWLADLPADSFKQIRGISTTEFRFPYYKTFFENGASVIKLSVPQVNALSQFTSYTVMESKEIFTNIP